MILTQLAAVTTLLDDAKKAFEAERQKKQVLITQAHERLRENKSRLAEERERLEELERKSDERKSLRMRVTNLQRANHVLRSSLGNRSDLRTNISIGEADAGLEIETAKLPSKEPYPTPLDPTSPEIQYVTSLPPTEILQARAEAYKANNDRLQTQINNLKNQSSELESQLKKVVSLCTRVEIERVDEVLPRLLAAVESERGEDLSSSRLHELLRQVERETEAGGD